MSWEGRTSCLGNPAFSVMTKHVHRGGGEYPRCRTIQNFTSATGQTPLPVIFFLRVRTTFSFNFSCTSHSNPTRTPCDPVHTVRRLWSIQMRITRMFWKHVHADELVLNIIVQNAISQPDARQLGDFCGVLLTFEADHNEETPRLLCHFQIPFQSRLPFENKSHPETLATRKFPAKCG